MKGAFTGAYADQPGLFETSLVVARYSCDELGELPPFLQ
jgi:transcriptional regulator with GAF, ATPase, and Fis domain